MVLSLVAEARDEIARQSRPDIKPPTPDTIDSLRRLAGPLSADPIVSNYADQRAQQRAPTAADLTPEGARSFAAFDRARDPLNFAALDTPPAPTDLAQLQRQAFQAPAESPFATALRQLGNAGLDTPLKVDEAVYQRRVLADPSVPLQEKNGSQGSIGSVRGRPDVRNIGADLIPGVPGIPGTRESVSGGFGDILPQTSAAVNAPFEAATRGIESIPTGGGTNVGERISNAPNVPGPFPRALEHAGNLGVSLAPYIVGGVVAKAVGAGAAFTAAVDVQQGVQVAAMTQQLVNGEMSPEEYVKQLGLIALQLGGAHYGPAIIKGLHDKLATLPESPRVKAALDAFQAKGADMLARLQNEQGSVRLPGEPGVPGVPVKPGARSTSADQVYDAARAEAGAATRTFAEAQKSYRARTIGDAEFLAAKTKHDAAMSIFDDAETTFINAKNAQPGVEGAGSTSLPAMDALQSEHGALTPGEAPKPGEAPEAAPAPIREGQQLPFMGGGTTPPEYAMASAKSLNIDPRMQARAVAQGTTFDPRVVRQMRENYDPALMTPLDVAPTPGKPGEYTVLGGMHRRQFGVEAGIDLPVRVHNVDISTPEGLKRAMSIADSSNLTQRDMSLKGTINAINRAGTTDVGELRAKYPRLNDQQIIDAQHIAQLPGHVIDKLDALPASSPQISIAAEIGRGAKVYGLSPEQGEGLFNKFTTGPRKGMPTRVEVREAVDLYGPKMREQNVGSMQGGMFGAEVATNPLVDAMIEHARLSKEINSAQTQLARDIAGAQRIGVGETSRQIVKAKQELAAIGARLDQLDRGFLGKPGADIVRPRTSATSTGEADASAVTSSIEGVPGRGPQAPPATVSTMGEPPSGSITRNTEPSGALRGATSSENITSSVPPGAEGAGSTSLPPDNLKPPVAAGGAGGVLPPETPRTAVGGAEPPSRPPTIPEIEARSKPLTPEQRSRIQRTTDQAAYSPQEFKAASENIIRQAPADYLQSLQNVMQKFPVLKQLGGFLEPIGAAVSKAAKGDVIPLAMVKRDLYATIEKSRARAAVLGWMGEHGKLLGIDGKGIAKDVQVREGAVIPKKAIGRLDDIIEHPEDYVLSPEQKAAIEPLVQSQTAVLQRELEAGVDVREVQDGYFARVVTKAPKGLETGGSGRSLGSRPGHAKLRSFPDVRSGIEAGFQYASPIEAITHRLETGIDAIAGRKTLEAVKALGEKPSERVGQSTRDTYLAAKEAYKAARTPENATALDEARRGLRVAATRANEPRLGEAKAFGRILPASVTDELAKYTNISEPGALEQFFAIQRASATSSDLSALFIQGGNLFYRNNPAWWKSAGYSIVALARDPVGYVAHNAASIDAGIKAGGINAPSEFLLNRTAGRGLPSKVGAAVANLPVIKQTQRSFEWFTFVGQSELWKASERMVKSPADAAELGAVIRKETGTMLRPGLTSAQRKAEIGTFFAGRFAMAVNATAADALRGGLRGQEARKTMGMVIGGATALTIAGQLYTDGTMPNLTDPNSRDKPWLSIKRPGGTVNLFGPLYPYVKAYASIGQNLAEGKPRAAGDDAIFLARSRLSLPLSSVIDLITQENVLGEPINGPADFAKSQAKRFVPISAQQITEGGPSQQQTFPEGNAQVLGLRANPATDYRLAANAGGKFLQGAGGDFAKAREAAITSGDNNAADNLTYQWRKDFEKRATPQGLTILPGSQDPPRSARVELQSWVDSWKADGYGAAFASALKIPAADNIASQRVAFVDQNLKQYMLTKKVVEKVARAALGDSFDASAPAKSYEKARKAAYLGYWSAHPDLLYEAWQIGVETLNDDERKILSDAAKAGAVKVGAQ